MELRLRLRPAAPGHARPALLLLLALTATGALAAHGPGVQRPRAMKRPVSTKPVSTKPASTKPASTKPASIKPLSMKPAAKAVTPGAAYRPTEYPDVFTRNVPAPAAPAVNAPGLRYRLPSAPSAPGGSANVQTQAPAVVLQTPLRAVPFTEFGGGYRVDLDETYAVSMLARIEPSGQVTVGCVDGKPTIAQPAPVEHPAHGDREAAK